MSALKPIPAGTVFGRLKVIGHHSVSPAGHSKSLCQCGCGNTAIILNTHLRTGNTQSCGCYNNENRQVIHLKHGHNRRNGLRSPTHWVWATMNQRCYNPRSISYANYGGRGIVVCQAWRDSYSAFLESVGERPNEKLSIDRIDNNGNYSCGMCDECRENGWLLNCCWATRIEQNRNKRSPHNHVITVHGVTACLSELCERFGVPYKRTKSRLYRGFSPEAAFASESLQHGPRKAPRLL